MNSKDSNLLSSIMNERLIDSSCFLSDLSLPFTSWVTTMVIETSIIKIWTGKGMIYKLVPPLSGLIGLITGCIIDGVAGTLLLVPISIDTKLGGFLVEIKENSLVGL